MKSTTEEIIERIGNAAGEMAGSLKIHNEDFAAQHIAVIDADLAELRERFAVIYFALKDADRWVDYLRINGCDGGAVVSALARIRAARATVEALVASDTPEALRELQLRGLRPAAPQEGRS